ncbi:hypothetical protein B296_00015215 [Ensete ventricosum]|uniref:Uncharacterized protein n=1 Tax=Ensete ventricosum TaxID=4639 RepID=A0A426YPB3_ENSVE|nr:hypothetical protein B296_00015215 [Ensete ventricosum]
MTRKLLLRRRRVYCGKFRRTPRGHLPQPRGRNLLVIGEAGRTTESDGVAGASHRLHTTTAQGEEGAFLLFPCSLVDFQPRNGTGIGPCSFLPPALKQRKHESPHRGEMACGELVSLSICRMKEEREAKTS